MLARISSLSNAVIAELASHAADDRALTPADLYENGGDLGDLGARIELGEARLWRADQHITGERGFWDVHPGSALLAG